MYLHSPDGAKKSKELHKTRVFTIKFQQFFQKFRKDCVVVSSFFLIQKTKCTKYSIALTLLFIKLFYKILKAILKI